MSVLHLYSETMVNKDLWSNTIFLELKNFENYRATCFVWGRGGRGLVWDGWNAKVKNKDKSFTSG